MAGPVNMREASGAFMLVGPKTRGSMRRIKGSTYLRALLKAANKNRNSPCYSLAVAIYLW